MQKNHQNRQPQSTKENKINPTSANSQLLATQCQHAISAPVREKTKSHRNNRFLWALGFQHELQSYMVQQFRGRQQDSRSCFRSSLLPFPLHHAENHRYKKEGRPSRKPDISRAAKQPFLTGWLDWWGVEVSQNRSLTICHQ